MKAPIPPGKSAFTLTELLVVMGVLVLLVSLLVPGMTRMKQLANQTRSLNNLRSISQSVLSYTQDHDGYLPKLMNAWNPPFWTDAIGDYLSAPIKGGGWSSDQNWTQSPTLVDPLLSNKLHHSISDYGVNNDLIREYDIRKIQGIMGSSGLVLAMTAREGPSNPQGTWFVAVPQYIANPTSGNTRPDERGVAKTVLSVFCDGHTEAIPRQTFEDNRKQYLQVDK